MPFRNSDDSWKCILLYRWYGYISTRTTESFRESDRDLPLHSFRDTIEAFGG